MNIFKEITERIGEWGDSRIIILPEDTARVIMSAMEDFIEELKEAVTENDHVFKQTSRYEEIEDCLVAVLLLLHKLVLLHDKQGWVTSGAVYSEN